jgi:mitogen-activated protein kinase kinase 3
VVLLVGRQPPRQLDKRTTITLGEKTFDCDSDDLVSLEVLGRGAYGVVEKMKHVLTGTVMAVKVIREDSERVR